MPQRRSVSMSAKLPLDRSSALLVAIGLTAVLIACSLLFGGGQKKRPPLLQGPWCLVPAFRLGRDYPPAEADKEYAYEKVSRHRSTNPTAWEPRPSCR